MELKVGDLVKYKDGRDVFVVSDKWFHGKKQRTTLIRMRLCYRHYIFDIATTKDNLELVYQSQFDFYDKTK